MGNNTERRLIVPLVNVILSTGGTKLFLLQKLLKAISARMRSRGCAIGSVYPKCVMHTVGVCLTNFSSYSDVMAFGVAYNYSPHTGHLYIKSSRSSFVATSEVS